jgi:hypothetical protein
MSNQSQKAQAMAAAAEAEPEAGYQLLDEWLRIENEHANPGFVLPGREAFVAWSETHPIAVLFTANLAVFAPMFGAIYFG